MVEKEFFHTPLTKGDLLADPIEQFSLWFDTAKAKGELEPCAMSFSTVNRNYDVFARMLLLKSVDKDGFVFFTNYLSPKAQQLKEIPKAAMVFWWPLCQRQVRITGSVTIASKTQSDEYFASRSRDSQIAAIVSKQSEEISSREELMGRYEVLAKEYEKKELSRPQYWGGYILSPQTLEFWQGRPHRLHDRFLYRKKGEAWSISQLSP